LLSDGFSVTGRLSEPEIASALTRRHRESALTIEERDQLMRVMQRDLASLYVVEISPEVSALACSLLMRHKLRAGDAIHLASALFLASKSDLKVQFVAFDETLNEAAKKEGLEIVRK
jgi:predicted nucleic acid-binding protein